MAVKAGSFAKSTGAAPASQAVTGVGFQPKALILWSAGSTTANAYQAAIRTAMGVTDGTTSGCIAASCDDATASSNTSRRTATAVMCLIDGSGTVLAEADLTSLDADGFTLNWTTNDANATIINYLALGGTALQAKVLQWQMPTVTGNYAVTGVGFQPDAMLHIDSKSASLDANSTGAVFNLAFSAATAGWSAGWTHSDNQAAGRGICDVSTTDLLDFAATSDFVASIVSMDADGFTYSFPSNAPASAYYAYQLCLKGGSYAQGTTTKTTDAAPVTQTVTGLGHTPEGMLIIEQGNDGVTYSLCFVVGGTDGTNERCTLITDEYDAATIEAKNYTGNTKVLVQDFCDTSTTPDQTTDSECDFGGFASGQFSLDWTTNDANANQIGYWTFAFGAAATTATKMIHYKRLRQ